MSSHDGDSRGGVALGFERKEGPYRPPTDEEAEVPKKNLRYVIKVDCSANNRMVIEWQREIGRLPNMSSFSKFRQRRDLLAAGSSVLFSAQGTWRTMSCHPATSHVRVLGI
jgi:hypothetical protein